jgi:hypothetical protein
MWQFEVDAMSDAQVEETITWVPTSSYFYWSTTLQDVSIGDDSIKLSVNNAIYMTTEPITLVPKADYSQLIALLTKDKDCVLIDQQMLCKCEDEYDDSFPTLKLAVGPNLSKLVVEPHWYLVFLQNYGGKKGCLIQFKAQEEQDSLYWVMGTAFLRSHI